MGGETSRTRYERDGGRRGEGLQGSIPGLLLCGIKGTKNAERASVHEPGAHQACRLQTLGRWVSFYQFKKPEGHLEAQPPQPLPPYSPGATQTKRVAREDGLQAASPPAREKGRR